MLVLLSPAKTLDYKRPLPELVPTEPRFAQEAMSLATEAAKLTERDLSRIMSISASLAELNVERYRGFAGLPERPALFAFAGDVYMGFEARTLDEAAIDFAQDHVRILSGLYGLLRPLDAIRPYRLEMGTRWAPQSGDLYAHWGTRISDLLAQDMAAQDSNVIVNLASKEYWGAVERHPPADADIYTIEFMEEGPAGLRFNSFAAKRARGMMARYISEHRLTEVEALQDFDTDGYAYDPVASDERRWRFTRE